MKTICQHYIKAWLLVFSLFSMVSVSAEQLQTSKLSAMQLRKESLKADCVNQCNELKNSCSIDKRHQGSCGDRHRICVERCDPQRIDRNSALSIYPPTQAQREGPRHKLPYADQLAICVQTCSMNNAACQGNSNSNNGPASGTYGGGNAPSDCQLGDSTCTLRCKHQLAWQMNQQKAAKR